MQFKDIVGQAQIKKHLIDSVHQQRISHAQLFLGNEGSGALLLAIAYAQYIACSNPSPSDSCGTCRSCIKFNKLAHPDLHFVYPVATSAKVKTKPISDNYLGEWREIINIHQYFTLLQWLEFIGVENKQGLIATDEAAEIIRKLSLKTYEAEYKCMIIWMPEKMNNTSANKLLKMIEEPPSKTLFLLVAKSADQIITTIRSRTQLLKIPAIAAQDIEHNLQETYNTSPEAAQSASRIAAGCLIKARTTVNGSETTEAFFSMFTTWMRACYGRDILKITELAEQQAKWSREKLKNYINYASQMLRENLILNQTPEQSNRLNYMNQQEMEFSQKFNRFIHPGNIIYITNELELAHKHIGRNGSERLIMLDLSLKITRLLRR